MSKNTESYLRYLKTFLNNNKYNFNIKEIDDYIDIPLFKCLEKINVSKDTFKVKKIKEDLTLKPQNKATIDNLHLNPLLETNNDAPEDFLSYRRDFIKKNKTGLLNKDLFNKVNYLFNKKTHSQIEKSILISYGQLTFDKHDKSYSFPVILQKVSIEKSDENFILSYTDSPLINFEAIREIPNISVKSLNLIKEVSSSLQEFFKEESEVKEALLQIFEALQYTTCKNLNIVSTTNILLTDKYIPIDTLINHTLRSDCSKDSALEKLLGNINDTANNYTFSNVELFSVSLKDKLLNLLENDINFIKQRHNNDNVEFLLKAFAAIFEKNKKVAYVSADKRYLDKLTNSFNNLQEPLVNGEKNNSTNQFSKIENKFNRIKENLKAEFKSFRDSNPYKLETNVSKASFHKIKAPDEEFWQDSINETSNLMQVFNGLDGILIEEFERFNWSVKVAELCKNKNEYKKWQDLLTYIENYFKYNDNIVDFNDSELEFKLNYSEYSLHVLDEILEYLKTNKKIPSFGIGVKTSWRNFIREVLVEGEIPQTLDDFKIIEKHLKFYISKEKLIDLWNKLMPKIGAVNLDSNDSLFEKKLNSYYQPIKKSVNWYKNIWHPFLTNLISAGFIWQRFLTEFMNVYIEYGLIKMLIMGGLKELTKLINSKMLELNLKEDLYDLSYNSEEFNFLSLDNYKSLLDNLNKEDRRIFSQILSKQKNSIDFFSLNEFYEKLLTDDSTTYDILIIDDSELLSMNNLILLAYCEQAIILGDSDFVHVTTDKTFNNYEKVFDALLPEIDHTLFSGKRSLAQILGNLTSNIHTLVSLNDINPRINQLCNNISKETTAISHNSKSLSLYSGYGEVDLENIEKFVLTLKNSFRNKELFNEPLFLYINKSEEIYIDKLKSYIISDINDSNLPDLFLVKSLSEIKNYLSNYLIVFDIDETNLVSKNDLYNLSVNTNNQLAYITDNKKGYPVIDFIQNVSKDEIDNYETSEHILFNKNIYALDNVKYEDIDIEIMVFSSEVTLLLRDSTPINNNLIDLILIFDCLVFHENDSKSIENFVRSLNKASKNDVLLDFVQEFIDISIEDKKSKEIVEDYKESQEESFDDSEDDIFTRSYIVTGNKCQSPEEIEKQPMDTEIEVEDLSDLPEDIVKTNKSFDLEDSETEELPPSSKFDKSISLDDQSDSSLNHGQESFNIIKWLEEKDINYYDYRPKGDLWIVDSVKTRVELKELKEKGFSFSLSLRNEKLPNNINAWKLE